MQPHPDIQAELAALDSVLAGYPRRMPFAVPQGYLAEAAMHLVEGVHASEGAGERTVPGATRAMPYAVPDGYFEALPGQLLEAAFLADLPQRTPAFSVPAGYFEGLPETVLAAAKAATATKVVPLPVPSRRTRTIALPALRWAAAAALVLSVGIGLYRASNPASAPATARRALAAVPQKDLHEYVLQNIDDFDTDLLSSEARVNATPATPLNPADIQAYLADDANLL